MTGDKKSIEFFFGSTTYLCIVISIVVRPDMEAHDKVLTVAMIQGATWLGKLFFRTNKDKIMDLNESYGATINSKPLASRQLTKDQLISSPKEN